MTPYEFIKKCEDNGWTLRIKLISKPWRIKIEGEPVDKVNEAMKILRQDIKFEARVILALAHYHAFYDENSILLDLIAERQFIRANDGLPTDPVLAVLDKMRWGSKCR